MSTFTDKLMREKLVSSDAVIDACAHVPRIEFVPVKFRDAAHADIPLPLGYGHIMPAPSTIAFMLDALMCEQGQSVLIAGCGSGWVVALLIEILDGRGTITAYDMSDALVARAQANVETFVPLTGVTCTWHVTHGCDPELKEILYDRIVIFNPQFCPCHLEAQLAPDGVMVAPRRNVITRYVRHGDAPAEEEPLRQQPFLPTGT